MALTFRITASNACEGGRRDIRFSLNGAQHHEGRVVRTVAEALAAMDDDPWTVDDLFKLVLRCARAQNLTLAQIQARTLTVDFTSANVVTFS